jgi:hypothetical protein
MIESFWTAGPRNINATTVYSLLWSGLGYSMGALRPTLSIACGKILYSFNANSADQCAS